MYAPYPENMMESIKKVEATRAERMATEPKRLTADEKDTLLKKFHPDYNPDAFAEIKVGPNKGQKAPLELAEMLHSESRLLNEKIDLNKIDYDVDVLVIGGGDVDIVASLSDQFCTSRSVAGLVEHPLQACCPVCIAGGKRDLDGMGRKQHLRDRKSTRLNSSHIEESRMPSSA